MPVTLSPFPILYLVPNSTLHIYTFIYYLYLYPSAYPYYEVIFDRTYIPKTDLEPSDALRVPILSLKVVRTYLFFYPHSTHAPTCISTSTYFRNWPVRQFILTPTLTPTHTYAVPSIRAPTDNHTLITYPYQYLFPFPRFEQSINNYNQSINQTKIKRWIEQSATQSPTRSDNQIEHWIIKVNEKTHLFKLLMFGETNAWLGVIHVRRCEQFEMNVGKTRSHRKFQEWSDRMGHEVEVNLFRWIVWLNWSNKHKQASR